MASLESAAFLPRSFFCVSPLGKYVYSAHGPFVERISLDSYDEGDGHIQPDSNLKRVAVFQIPFDCNAKSAHVTKILLLRDMDHVIVVSEGIDDGEDGKITKMALVHEADLEEGGRVPPEMTADLCISKTTEAAVEVDCDNQLIVLSDCVLTICSMRMDTEEGKQNLALDEIMRIPVQLPGDVTVLRKGHIFSEVNHCTFGEVNSWEGLTFTTNGVFTISDLKEKHLLKEDLSVFSCLEYTSCGLLCGGFDGYVALYSIAQQKNLRSAKCHRSAVVSFSSLNDEAASMSSEMILIWKMNKERCPVAFGMIEFQNDPLTSILLFQPSIVYNNQSSPLLILTGHEGGDLRVLNTSSYTFSEEHIVEMNQSVSIKNFCLYSNEGDYSPNKMFGLTTNGGFFHSALNSLSSITYTDKPGSFTHLSYTKANGDDTVAVAAYCQQSLRMVQYLASDSVLYSPRHNIRQKIDVLFCQENFLVIFIGTKMLYVVLSVMVRNKRLSGYTFNLKGADIGRGANSDSVTAQGSIMDIGHNNTDVLLVCVGTSHGRVYTLPVKRGLTLLDWNNTLQDAADSAPLEDLKENEELSSFFYPRRESIVHISMEDKHTIRVVGEKGSFVVFHYRRGEGFTVLNSLISDYDRDDAFCVVDFIRTQSNGKFIVTVQGTKDLVVIRHSEDEEEVFRIGHGASILPDSKFIPNAIPYNFSIDNLGSVVLHSLIDGRIKRFHRATTVDVAREVMVPSLYKKKKEMCVLECVDGGELIVTADEESINWATLNSNGSVTPCQTLETLLIGPSVTPVSVSGVSGSPFSYVVAACQGGTVIVAIVSHQPGKKFVDKQGFVKVFTAKKKIHHVRFFTGAQEDLKTMNELLFAVLQEEKLSILRMHLTGPWPSHKVVILREIGLMMRSPVEEYRLFALGSRTRSHNVCLCVKNRVIVWANHEGSYAAKSVTLDLESQQWQHSITAAAVCSFTSTKNCTVTQCSEFYFKTRLISIDMLSNFEYFDVVCVGNENGQVSGVIIPKVEKGNRPVLSLLNGWSEGKGDKVVAIECHSIPTISSNETDARLYVSTLYNSQFLTIARVSIDPIKSKVIQLVTLITCFTNISNPLFLGVPLSRMLKGGCPVVAVVSAERSFEVVSVCRKRMIAKEEEIVESELQTKQ